MPPERRLAQLGEPRRTDEGEAEQSTCGFDGAGLPIGVQLITGVLQKGPAAQAGVRPGDVVTQVAGQAVQNLNLMLGLPEETALPKEGLWP